MELIQSRRLWSKFLKANGYQLVSCIGQGSFGDVYSVTCLATGQPWAVKRLVARRDIQQDRYAMAEIEALACIQHPTVVGLREILLCPRVACIVMELAPEGSLEVLVLQRRGQNAFSMDDMAWSTIALRKLNCCSSYQDGQCFVPNNEGREQTESDGYTGINCAVSITCDDFSSEQDLVNDAQATHGQTVCRTDFEDLDSMSPRCSPPPSSPSCLTQALDPSFLSIAFVQIASALEFCHDMELAHRDVNPSNVLVFRPDLVKLADFGLCFQCRDKDKNNKYNDNEEESAKFDHLCTDFLGRDHYTAPEVRREEPFLAKPADVWSLGCVLYFMLTADHPPLKNSNLLDGISDGLNKLIPAGYDFELGKKCLATLEQACKVQVKERSTAKEILALWDT